MSLTYSSFVSEIATLTVVSSTVLVSGDTNFQGVMGQIIDQAEGMCYRDLDLPVVRVTDTSVICASGVRSITTSTAQGVLLVLETVNLLTSAGATSSFATRVPLTPAAVAVINAIYPSAASSNCAQPQMFARINDNTLILGPAPDQAYGTEMIATIRPAPLSAANSSTWLSQNLPELLVAAGMIAATGFMRDFGAQSDNPQMAQSWKGVYDALLKSALADSFRMKFQSQAWTGQLPNPATPPRA